VSGELSGRKQQNLFYSWGRPEPCPSNSGPAVLVPRAVRLEKETLQIGKKCCVFYTLSNFGSVAFRVLSRRAGRGATAGECGVTFGISGCCQAAWGLLSYAVYSFGLPEMSNFCSPALTLNVLLAP